MPRRHVMTPARRAALKKAQLASARKRRRSTNVAMYNQQRRRARTGKWKRRALTSARYTGVGLAVGYGAYRALTPAHRKLVDQQAVVVGRKIKRTLA